MLIESEIGFLLYFKILFNPLFSLTDFPEISVPSFFLDSENYTS